MYTPIFIAGSLRPSVKNPLVSLVKQPNFHCSQDVHVRTMGCKRGYTTDLFTIIEKVGTILLLKQEMCQTTNEPGQVKYFAFICRS